MVSSYLMAFNIETKILPKLFIKYIFKYTLNRNNFNVIMDLKPAKLGKNVMCFV